MIKNKIISSITAGTALIAVVIFFSCTSDKAELTNPFGTGYPPEIEAIIISKCATAGCHNEISHQAAGGIDLSTWDKLFEGGRGGAVVIPYRPDFSTLCYYTNTDSSQGLVLQPTMPFNSAPLTASEYSTLKTWIQNGAPDKNGFVKFSDFQDKSKLYVNNRGCDVVTVMDPVSGLAMRYIDVGNSSDIEGPSMIKVAPDKLHWYVIFNQGTTIQKFSTSDNTKVGELYLGPGIWTSLTITGDSKKAFISDASINGRIIYADIENMQITATYQNGLRSPFSMCLNSSNNRLYVTSGEGNYIYKIDITSPLTPLIEEISLEPGIPVSTNPTINPYAIILNNDETRYFVSCNKSCELRILQTSDDSLLGTFPTGSNPAEMIISTDYSYLFISCLGAPGTFKKSIINVFNYTSGTFLPEIDAGHDSKGIAIDQSGNKLFVANRNISAGGPAAHHAPVCEGKNGYITAIDLNSLQVISNFKVEVSVDPYGVNITD